MDVPAVYFQRPVPTILISKISDCALPKKYINTCHPDRDSTKTFYHLDRFNAGCYHCNFPNHHNAQLNTFSFYRPLFIQALIHSWSSTYLRWIIHPPPKHPHRLALILTLSKAGEISADRTSTRTPHPVLMMKCMLVFRRLLRTHQTMLDLVVHIDRLERICLRNNAALVNACLMS